MTDISYISAMPHVVSPYSSMYFGGYGGAPLSFMHPSLRLQAALLAAGVVTGDQMLALCRKAGLVPADMAQMKRGHLRWRDSQLARLEQILDVPEGYINGRAGFSGRPLDDPDVLDLPPWMLADGDSLRFDSCVLTKPLAHLNRRERVDFLTRCLGLSEDDLTLLIRGEVIPCGCQLQHVKYCMVQELGLDPTKVLPFVEAREPPQRVIDAALTRDACGTRKVGKDISPRVVQLVEDGALPAAWKGPLDQLQALVNAGKLVLNPNGCLPRQPFANNLQLQLDRLKAAYPSRKVFIHTLVERYPGLTSKQSNMETMLANTVRTTALSPDVALAVAEALQVSVFFLLGVDEA